jgi:hypothetical protein
MNPPDFGEFQNQLRLFENPEELVLFNIKTPAKKQKNTLFDLTVLFCINV